MLNKITEGDAIEEMRKLADKSVDMILCDLPYGTTDCKWDTVIPFKYLWTEYERVIKDNGAIVLTASQPFTSALIMSNPKLYKYNWIWEKPKSSNFMLAKKQPLKNYEEVCVFYKKQPTYNPQLIELTEQGKKRNKRTQNGTFNKTETVFGDTTRLKVLEYKDKTMGYPKAIVKFNNVVNNQYKRELLHPTQKPVDLFEYLIKTYSNEGDVILDNCIGSGTTAVAAINTGRQFIGIERETEYCEIARQRIADALKTEVGGK